MFIYNICNDYSLELADVEGIKEIRKNNVFTSTKGKVNGLPCIWWRNRWSELVAVEVDDNSLDGYVIGMT